VRLARAAPQRELRTFALTDFVWARAARAAARAAIEQARPDAVIYSTVTAALFAPLPGAIRFDALAAANRPGRHGIWQRPAELRTLSRARLLIPWSAASLDGAGELRARVIVVPVAVEPSGPLVAPGDRDIAAITYAANPYKKGLDRVLDAWRAARRDREELVVAGVDGLASSDGIRSVGMLAPAEYRALLRRARLYVTAPRREDHGLAQLEALADGCLLVSTPAPGPYRALELGRSFDPRLIGDDLAGSIRTALDDPRSEYVERALAAIGAYALTRIDAIVANELLPALIEAV
jgi:hypothetical protein